MPIRTKIISALSVCLALSLAAAPAFAHHSTAPYDMQNPVTVKGVVERLEWTNPHAYVYLSVKDDKGNVQEWAIEINSPNYLKHNGWTSTTLKPGDVISCTGGAAKSGAKTMRCTTVELANGEKLRS
jgi:DNA/RNA endonuclease YhcR with UshA esterase domain